MLASPALTAVKWIAPAKTHISLYRKKDGVYQISYEPVCVNGMDSLRMILGVAVASYSIRALQHSRYLGLRIDNVEG